MPTFPRLERCLLPPPETLRWDRGNLTFEKYTTLQKVSHYVKNFFAFTCLIVVSPLTLAHDWLTQKEITPLRRVPNLLPPPPAWPPVQRGFATSLFQTSGLGTKWSAPELHGKCDWDKWMDKPAHILHPEGFDYKNFFTDILSDPTAYIEMLERQNVTAHRFSLEWSVIEPKRGVIDKDAVLLYQNFIAKLLEVGITPSITLSHFTVPEWFYESGNFQKIENIDLFVAFAVSAMELFPNVKDWWSFNELGVKAFQQAREVYPTDLNEGSSLSERVHAAGIATRNMLIAHCKLHEAAARLHPDKKVGVTHQWLKFDTASGNLLERLFSYYFTKFAFTPIYQFFKEGRYSFEFPFMANIRFEIPKAEFEKNGHFLMRLGVQAYPQPMIKMGLNHNQTYPGLVQNLPLFTFGSTAEPGGTVMRFGPRWRAEAIDKILDEAFTLTDQIYITEYGSDANVHKWGRPRFELDDEAQANYLRQLTEKIRNYSARTRREIKGLFCWSDLRRQMEWENGHECRLGILDPVVDKNRKMTGWHPTPASQYLADVYDRQDAQDDCLHDKMTGYAATSG
jgi:beta-glucosidase/6-phospho-beta-glucosidase/beta-galactosidase